jgi:hypothetical protein
VRGRGALLVAALVFGGCVPFRVATPPGFVALKDQRPSYDYRAVSADGVVLAVRAIDHTPRGDLDFWVRAVEKQVRLLGGYALLKKEPVTAAAGLQGTQLRFGHDEGRTPHLYQVTLFVTPARIFLLEAGGTKAGVEAAAAQIDQAVRSFTPRLSLRSSAE